MTSRFCDFPCRVFLREAYIPDSPMEPLPLVRAEPKSYTGDAVLISDWKPGGYNDEAKRLGFKYGYFVTKDREISYEKLLMNL